MKVFCRELLRTFNICSPASEVLLSVLSFIVDNMKKYQTFSYTLHKHYMSQVDYTGTNLFNSLSSTIKSLSHGMKIFNAAL
jgi:hypothetical protein